MALIIPKRLAAICQKTPERTAWLEWLPEGLHGLERRWSLTLGVPFDSEEVSCAWVAPVARADGTPAVLKLGMPHMEGEHEIEGLRAQREPWLVIDPKPFIGDPAYDATQHLFNCEARLRSNPNGAIRRFADLLGVDHERVRLWMFARAVAEPRDEWKKDDLMALASDIAP